MLKLVKKIVSQSYLATILIATFLIVSSFTPFWNILLANFDNQSATKFINIIDLSLWLIMAVLLIVNFILFTMKMKKVISKKVSVKIIKNKQYVKTIINFVFSLVSLILIKSASIVIASQSFFNSYQPLSNEQNTLILVASILVPITFIVLSYVLFMYAKTDIYPPDDAKFIYWFIALICFDKSEQKAASSKNKKEIQNKFKKIVLNLLSYNKKHVETVINIKNKDIKICNLKMCNQPSINLF